MGDVVSALDLANPDIFALTFIGFRPAGEGNCFFSCPCAGDGTAEELVAGVCEVLNDEDENVRCIDVPPLGRLSWFVRDTSAPTAVRARCLDSGEDGAEAPTTDFDGGRTVTRAFTADAGVKFPLVRVGVPLRGDPGLGIGLNGDVGRDVGREVPAVLAVVLLVPATELEVETLRPIVALLFTFAFGRDNGGDREDCEG